MPYYGWRPYVPVGRRRISAAQAVQRLRKAGETIEPVEIEGQKIARTFWGQAWCKHLEGFSDYANRLPRGRTYVRNGSVCHLAISKGKIEALVSGSALYQVTIGITPLPSGTWDEVRTQCAGQIGSLLELLQGRFSDHVMAIVTNRATGLFPQPREIKLSCDCPDWAVMCKHVAAVLYGVGARLDHQPELLFLLRNVDHEALIATELDVHTATRARGKRRRLATQDLAGVFGVELEETPRPVQDQKSAAKPAAQKNPAAKTRKRRAVRARPATARRRKKGVIRKPTKAAKKIV
ncbi:MAG: SWIM zinc finger family protein [Acidiferrobacteraceae bacterium]